MNQETEFQDLPAYTVVTPVYEGPLDLLLQLIERAELDITKVALAVVTDQFIAYLNQMQERGAEEVSEFIVIASKLVQIKSEALLPRPPVRETGEEDPGEALARQLIAYKRYREIANILEERENAGLRTYLSLAPPPKIEGVLDLSDITLDDLLMAAKEVFSRSDTQTSLTNATTPPRITIRQKIGKITSLLKSEKKITFFSLLDNQHSRIEIVVTFLAILELIKRRFIHAHQEILFSDINLEASDQFNSNEEFDLEFDEY
jgi:segregation and condensation protein A